MAGRARLATLALAAVTSAVVLTSLRAGDGAPLAPAGGVHLAGFLRHYGIPEASQVLVFSRTSLQRDRISESTPRAIYFNDRASVGVVPGSSLIEVAEFDDTAGGVRFLTLDASRPDAPPRRERSCLRCHALADGGGMQGLLMRSSGVHEGGNPHRCLLEVDDRTPYGRRWGGWYVTGQLVPSGHAGRPMPTRLDAAYATGGSDIVALLVLGHEVTAVNLIARLAREARLAAWDQESGRTPDAVPLETAASALADDLLFSGEAPLPAAVVGDPAFIRAFESAGVRDSHGHSLRTFDLRRRLFKVPCSFMIHAPAFRALPLEVRRLVYDRMSALLRAGGGPHAPRLSPDDRDAVVHVLRETLADLPADFGTSPGRS